MSIWRLMRHSILFIYQNKLIFEALSLLLADSLNYHIKGLRFRQNTNFWSLPVMRQYDVIVAEFTVLNEDIFQAIKNGLIAIYEQQLLIITSHLENKISEHLIASGVDGILLTDCSSEDFLHAIEKLCSKDQYFCGRIMQDLVKNGLHQSEASMDGSLTSSELEVLDRIIKGQPNKRIASEFHISESTIKTHRKNIMSKLKAENSITLLYQAFEANFISESEIPLCKICRNRSSLKPSKN